MPRVVITADVFVLSMTPARGLNEDLGLDQHVIREWSMAEII